MLITWRKLFSTFRILAYFHKSKIPTKIKIFVRDIHNNQHTDQHTHIPQAYQLTYLPASVFVCVRVVWRLGWVGGGLLRCVQWGSGHGVLCVVRRGSVSKA